jgi:hypothetical protein
LPNYPFFVFFMVIFLFFSSNAACYMACTLATCTCNVIYSLT